MLVAIFLSVVRKISNSFLLQWGVSLDTTIYPVAFSRFCSPVAIGTHLETTYWIVPDTKTLTSFRVLGRQISRYDTYVVQGWYISVGV